MFDDEVVEEIYFLGLPELRLELILISISDTASSESIETPLIKLSSVSESSSMILVHVHVHKLYLRGIIRQSAEHRLGLHVLSTAKSTLAVIASTPKFARAIVLD